MDNHPAALELLRNRIDKFGVSEPSIRPRGAEAIEIQLPGVKDPMSVKKAIGTTGRVEYRLVDDEYTRLAGQWLAGNIHRFKDGKIPENPEEQYTILNEAAKAIGLPAKSELLFFYERDENTKKILAVLPDSAREGSRPGGQRYKQGLGGARRVRPPFGALYDHSGRGVEVRDSHLGEKPRQKARHHNRRKGPKRPSGERTDHHRAGAHNRGLHARRGEHPRAYHQGGSPSGEPGHHRGTYCRTFARPGRD
jgi:hypothetical protein